MPSVPLLRLVRPGKDNYAIVRRSANLSNQDPNVGLMKENGLGEIKERLTESQPLFNDVGFDLA